jgi:RimJ/RimL family protein N-acetyltransferase
MLSLVTNAQTGSMTTAIPTLTTLRLVLRPFEPGDLAPLAAIHADPQVMRYVGDGRPCTREQTWRSMATHLGHWQLRGYGKWAVVEQATGRLIGRAGLWQPRAGPGWRWAGCWRVTAGGRDWRPKLATLPSATPSTPWAPSMSSA